MTFRKKLKNFSERLRKIFSCVDICIHPDPIWREFLSQEVPIVLLTGPLCSGKTSLAHHLSENSNLRLLHIKHMSAIDGVDSLQKNRELVPLLKNEIKNSFKFCSGFIVDDFPPKMSEFRKFEHKIGEPSMVIYTALCLDATLGRVLAQNPTVDLNQIRVQYVKEFKFAEKILSRYTRKKKKALKVSAQSPMSEVHSKVVELLETECKFKHIPKLSTKNFE